MVMSRTDGSPQSSTAMYRPPGAAESRAAAELVAGSAPVNENELVPLLRRRLRFLLVVFALLYLIILILHLCYFSLPMRIDQWASATTFVICVCLAAVLSGTPWMTLRQLRVVEFLLCAVFAGRMVLRGYVLLWDVDYIDRVHAWIAAGDVANAREMLTGLAHRQIVVSAMFVVAYGVIIPNTWQRCAMVVAVFTFGPIAIWTVGCIARDLPSEYWFPFGVMIPILVLIQIAVLSVYGAYRIESSRQEAVEARRLGQYVLREKIGGGGMGEVYLADHVLLRRPCAIKLIRPERAGEPAMLQRFEREVRATARLTHPNTVQVFDYGHTPDGTFYYVMEYLPGITLEQLVKGYGVLTPERAVHFLRQLCGTLAEAHAIGLIHRDIKPGNVIVCERGGLHDVAKLLDFGLVLAQGVGRDGERLTQDGAIAGTPAYVSPEQASGREDLDARSDIYSVGCLAYFLLTGQPPFAGRSAVRMLAAHMYEPPAPPTTHRAEVPADMERVVLRCLAKDPSERYPSAQDLESALAGCLTPGRWTEEEAACWWRANGVPTKGACAGG
jgi:tRNA A-37 threonylcarbamoyl transferase component Bud32